MTPDQTVERDLAALQRLLGVPELAWLLARVRPRIAASHEAALSGVVRLDEPTDAQRLAAARLVGRPRRAGSSLRVDLTDVESILRRGPWPAGLADAVVTLTGPVFDRAGAREREATAWQDAASALDDVLGDTPGLQVWWGQWCGSGGLKRAARAEAVRIGVDHGPEVGARLVQHLAAVLHSLPSAGEPLAVLARRVTGDAHALDASRPLGRIAAAAVEAAYTPGATSGRDAWAACGVVLSTVASTVLCLGVPGKPGEPGEPGTVDPAAHATGAALEAMRAARMPLVLTLDQVRSGGPVALSAERVVHVCENPTIVEVAAERWRRAPAGSAAPVLVCTSGQPSTAVVDLLAVLVARGAECRYHGDFDWPGLRIAHVLGERVAWRPWRFIAADYLSEIDRSGLSRRLEGRPALSPWDPELATAMAEHGLAVEEEAVADLLARDLLSDAR